MFFWQSNECTCDGVDKQGKTQNADLTQKGQCKTGWPVPSQPDSQPISFERESCGIGVSTQANQCRPRFSLSDCLRDQHLLDRRDKENGSADNPCSKKQREPPDPAQVDIPWPANHRVCSEEGDYQ